MQRLVWRISRFPELQHLPSEHRKAMLRRSAGVTTWIALGVRSLLVGIFAAALLATAISRPGLVTAGISAGAGLLAALAAYQWLLLRIRAVLRYEILRGLRGERVPACLRCAYDVRDATSDRCPECGARIRVPCDA